MDDADEKVDSEREVAQHSSTKGSSRCSSRYYSKWFSHLFICRSACNLGEVIIGKLLLAKALFIECVEDFFEELGYTVFDNPWKFIVIPTLLCLICSLGFFWRVAEFDMEKLYSLPKTPSAIAKQELNQIFPIERLAYIFVISDEKGKLLSYDNLSKMGQLWDKVITLKVPKSLSEEANIPGDYSIMKDWLQQHASKMMVYDPDYKSLRSSKKYTEIPKRPKSASLDYLQLADVCVVDHRNSCEATSPLHLYATPALWGQPLRSKLYPLLINYRTQIGYRTDSILSGVMTKQWKNVTEIHNATGAMFRFKLNGHPDFLSDSMTWEQGLLALIVNLKIPGLQLYVESERSIQDELAQSCQLRGEDLMMLSCAAVFVFLFTIAMSWSHDIYRNKWFPSAVGVCSAILAYGGALGLCHYFGLRHVPPSESTPFILLGIGVDDIFVITNAYSMTYLHSESARTRIGLSLRDAGISVTITTLTNIVAFTVGAVSPYYSIFVFCTVTAAGLIVEYILALTLFCGVLSLNALREQEQLASSWKEDIAAISVKSGETELTTAHVTPSLKLHPNGASQNEKKFPSIIELQQSDSLSNVVNNEFLTDYVPMAIEMTTTPSEVGTTTTTDNDVQKKCPLQQHDDSNNNDGPSTAAIEDCKKQLKSSFTPLSRFVAIESLDNNLVAAERVSKIALRQWLKKCSANNIECSIGRPDSSTLQMRETSSLSFVVANNNNNKCQQFIHNSLLQFNNNNNFLHEIKKADKPSPVKYVPITIKGKHYLQPQFNIVNIPRYVNFHNKLVPIQDIDFIEPPGTVGRFGRAFFMNTYGPFLMKPMVKILVLISFALISMVSFWNSFKVQPGMRINDVTPIGSYLREFTDIRAQYFSTYGEECVVFFPNPTDWWRPEIQQRILDLTNFIRADKNIVYIQNGFEEFMNFMKNRQNDPQSPYFNVSSNSDRQRDFIEGLEAYLQTPRGLIVKNHFMIQNGTVKYWKFYYWMSFVDNTKILINWVSKVQKFLTDSEKLGYFKGHLYTPLGILIESDPVIFKATMTNMGVALLTMGFVAALLIPDLKSGLMVLFVIFMIDVNVYGFMPIWGLNLNMLTMVNLVLSIGFAVDYTAHITHCFNHCKGATRDYRAIETLVLMGIPVTNGMLSTYAAVGALSITKKYALLVVFRMTTSVLAFAFLHGLILMPVVLSLIGPMNPHEIDILEIRTNSNDEMLGTGKDFNGTTAERVVATWTIDATTGEVLKHQSHHTIKRRNYVASLADSI